MVIQGKPYDVLKFIALIVLPALGALYFTLAGIWGLPAAEQVLGTIAAIDTFLGVVLKISNQNFAGTAVGTMKILEDEEKKVFSLEIDGDPEFELENAKRVSLKVEKVPTYLQEGKPPVE